MIIFALLKEVLKYCLFAIVVKSYNLFSHYKVANWIVYIAIVVLCYVKMLSSIF